MLLTFTLLLILIKLSINFEDDPIYVEVYQDVEDIENTLNNNYNENFEETF